MSLFLLQPTSLCTKQSLDHGRSPGASGSVCLWRWGRLSLWTACRGPPQCVPLGRPGLPATRFATDRPLTCSDRYALRGTPSLCEERLRRAASRADVGPRSCLSVTGCISRSWRGGGYSSRSLLRSASSEAGGGAVVASFRISGWLIRPPRLAVQPITPLVMTPIASARITVHRARRSR